MQELEDEPEDVRNASPVEEEIMKAQINEFSKKANPPKKFKEQPPRKCCPKDRLVPRKNESCPKKEKKKKLDLPPVPLEFCTKDPYKRIKQELIPRHCMKKPTYLDYLAAPKFIRKSQMPLADTDEEKSRQRKVRTEYPRTEWLSKPTKRRMLMTLLYQGKTLPAKNVDNLIQVLEDETALTPEQAEALIRDKRNAKKRSKRNVSKGKKCQKKVESVKETLGAGDPSLDLEVAQCQYSMAQRFVRSILNWKCSYPRDDYRDISEAILDKLSAHLEYTPIGKEDRKSEQMRILADVFACWISEILIMISKKYGDEVDEERENAQECVCVRTPTDEDDDDYTDEEDGYPKYLEARCGKEQREKCTQVQEIIEDDIESEVTDEVSTISSDSCIDEEQQTEPKPKMDSATTTQDKTDKQVKMDECTMADVKCTDQIEIENITSRICQAFQTDVPFVTFAKILDTLYCMIGSEPENDLCCPMDNRIHRAIYEKFEEVMQCENPKLLNERTKDVLDVVTGKLARWLRRALTQRQIQFFNENPAEVESNEIRNWAKWIDNTANFADCWSNWIHKVTMEAQSIKQAGGTTRGNWQNWTGKFENNAMLYRRKYLETIHQQHHNVMMFCDRNVLKTCTKKKPQYSETTLRNTNYESCSKMQD